jgi:hypothetical protein
MVCKRFQQFSTSFAVDQTRQDLRNLCKIIILGELSASLRLLRQCLLAGVVVSFVKNRRRNKRNKNIIKLYRKQLVVDRIRIKEIPLKRLSASNPPASYFYRTNLKPSQYVACWVGRIPDSILLGNPPSLAWTSYFRQQKFNFPWRRVWRCWHLRASATPECSRGCPISARNVSRNSTTGTFHRPESLQ